MSEQRTRRVRLVPLALSAAALLGVTACGSDEPSGGETSTSASIVPAQLTVDELNAEVNAYAEENNPDAAWLGQVEIKEVSGEGEIVVGPTGGNDLDAALAVELCGAVTTVAYRGLPTAVVEVQDAGGAVLADNSGAGGSCEAV